MIHFYCYFNNKNIIISDYPSKDVKAKFGHRFELVNSVKEKESVDIIKEKILKSYSNFVFIEFYKPAKRVLSAEARKKISDSKVGLKRDAATRAKISAGLKGRSNFQGKKHNEGTKAVMSDKKLGNNHVKDKVWAHDPRCEKEIRVKDRRSIPVGFVKGRDYYSIENFIYYGKGKKLEY
jgi:hypothetical protein